MSSEQAEEYADAVIKQRKAIKIAGTILASAAAGYLAYKLYDDYKDYTKVGEIKAGHVLQRIERFNTKELHEAFYASANEHDNKIYGAALGGSDNYKMQIKVSDTIKVAPHNAVKNAVKELVDKDRSVRDYLRDNGINPSNIDKRNYDQINQLLVDNSSGGRNLQSKLYEKLREDGYGALRDVNDKKYSGFRAKDPLIIIDKAKVVVENVEHRTGDMAAKAAAEQAMVNKAHADLYLKQYGLMGAALASGTAAITSSEAKKQKQYEEIQKRMATKNMYNETYLQHHGVLGQKWGVRRYRNKDGTVTPAGKRHYKESLREKASSMSDKELDQAVNRLKKEKEFIELSSKSIDQGSAYVKNLAIVASTTLVATAVTTAASKTGQAIAAGMIKGVFGEQIFKALYKNK